MAQTLEARMAALEAIVKKSQITLTDESDPNSRIILNFSDGNFKITKQTVTVQTEELNLTNIETNA